MTTLKESELVVGLLYKIQIREDFSQLVKEKYSYFYYNGLKETKYTYPYHEFIPKLKTYRKKDYVLRLNINDHQSDYEYNAEGKTTGSYHFVTDCFVDKKGLINMPSIKDDDLYGYDTLHFNVYGPISEEKKNSKNEKTLAQREKDLAQREKDLAQREKDLAQREKDLAQREDALEKQCEDEQEDPNISRFWD